MHSLENELIIKLRKQNSFWSFDMDNNVSIPADIIIEKTLIHLDIDDINLLFKIYPYKKVKQVWKDRLAIQGAYYARLNKLLAFMYFDIKNPEKYLKTIERNHLKSFQ